jgi:hypothetical protein
LPPVISPLVTAGPWWGPFPFLSTSHDQATPVFAPPPPFQARLWSALFPTHFLDLTRSSTSSPLVWPRFDLARLGSISHTNSSPWWWRQQAPLKRRQTSTRLHGATTQNKHLDFNKFQTSENWF